MRKLALLLLFVVLPTMMGQDYIVQTQLGCVANTLFALSYEDTYDAGTSTPQSTDYALYKERKDYTPDTNLTLTRSTTGGAGEVSELINASADMAGFFSQRTKGIEEAYTYDCTGATCINFSEGRLGFLFRYLSAGSDATLDPQIIRWSAAGNVSGIWLWLEDIPGGDTDGDKGIIFFVETDNDPTTRWTIATPTEAIVVGGTYYIEVMWDTNNAGATDELEIWVDGTKVSSSYVVNLGAPQDSDLKTLTVGTYNDGRGHVTATTEFLYDAINVSSHKGRNLYADVCGSTTACTGGQKGSYCR